VFWACGVTPQAVAMQAKPPLMLTHAPGTCSSPISGTRNSPRARRRGDRRGTGALGRRGAGAHEANGSMGQTPLSLSDSAVGSRSGHAGHLGRESDNANENGTARHFGNSGSDRDDARVRGYAQARRKRSSSDSVSDDRPSAQIGIDALNMIKVALDIITTT